MSYVAAYVALDWGSYIEPYTNFNITPWNPNTALSFILIVVAVGFCGSNLAEMARCRAKQVA